MLKLSYTLCVAFNIIETSLQTNTVFITTHAYDSACFSGQFSIITKNNLQEQCSLMYINKPNTYGVQFINNWFVVAFGYFVWMIIACAFAVKFSSDIYLANKSEMLWV